MSNGFHKGTDLNSPSKNTAPTPAPRKNPATIAGKRANKPISENGVRKSKPQPKKHHYQRQQKKQSWVGILVAILIVIVGVTGFFLWRSVAFTKDKAAELIKQEACATLVEPSSDAIEDEPSSSEETAPSEEVPAESEVVEEPSEEGSVPTAQEIENIYRDFVAQNFSGHYIALKADVTHDGIEDLLVVNYQDIPDWGGDAYTEDGYVYTWQSNGVKLLKHDYDMNVQGGSGLLWYLRRLDNGMYNLIDVDNYVHQGYNSATIRELSLTANGDEILEKPIYKFGEQGQPISDDEYDAYESKLLEVTNGSMELSPFNVEGGSPYRLSGTVVIDSSIIISNKM